MTLALVLTLNFIGVLGKNVLLDLNRDSRCAFFFKNFHQP